MLPVDHIPHLDKAAVQRAAGVDSPIVCLLYTSIHKYTGRAGMDHAFFAVAANDSGNAGILSLIHL